MKVIVVIYIEVFLLYGIFGVVSHLHASLKDGELYRMVHDGFGIDFIIYMCMILMGEQVICALIKEKVKWKQLIAGIVGLVVTITYGLTVYDSYYEDKIVVQRFIKNTEYDWEDVQSYSVNVDGFPNLIQVELEMKDRTLLKISGEGVSSLEYDERFSNDYLYVAYIVEKLDQLGISGKLEDYEGTEEEVWDWDEEERKAVAKIRKIVIDK